MTVDTIIEADEVLCITYTAAKAHPPLIELLGLPEGFIPYMASLVGYPAETFNRIPSPKAA